MENHFQCSVCTLYIILWRVSHILWVVVNAVNSLVLLIGSWMLWNLSSDVLNDIIQQCCIVRTWTTERRLQLLLLLDVVCCHSYHWSTVMHQYKWKRHGSLLKRWITQDCANCHCRLSVNQLTCMYAYKCSIHYRRVHLIIMIIILYYVRQGSNARGGSSPKILVALPPSAPSSQSIFSVLRNRKNKNFI